MGRSDCRLAEDEHGAGAMPLFRNPERDAYLARVQRQEGAVAARPALVILDAGAVRTERFDFLTRAERQDEASAIRPVSVVLCSGAIFPERVEYQPARAAQGSRPGGPTGQRGQFDQPAPAEGPERRSSDPSSASRERHVNLSRIQLPEDTIRLIDQSARGRADGEHP